MVWVLKSSTCLEEITNSHAEHLPEMSQRCFHVFLEYNSYSMWMKLNFWEGHQHVTAENIGMLHQECQLAKNQV